MHTGEVLLQLFDLRLFNPLKWAQNTKREGVKDERKFHNFITFAFWSTPKGNIFCLNFCMCLCPPPTLKKVKNYETFVRHPVYIWILNSVNIFKPFKYNSARLLQGLGWSVIIKVFVFVWWECINWRIQMFQDIYHEDFRQ